MTHFKHSFLGGLRYVLFLAGLALFVSGTASVAQVNLGEIDGTVTDPSGAVVPGTTVTAKNLANNATRSATTSRSCSPS